VARKVFISSDMSVDETISEIAEQDSIAALMWPWILTYFDDWGRAKASPREIKNSVFQANELITTSIISKAISLYDGRLVQMYEVEGKPYMCIDPDKWFKYQTHIRKEKRENDGSKHPAPLVAECAQVRASARGSANFSDNLTDCIPSPSPSLSKDTTTTDEVHRKVFGTLSMNGLMSDYVMTLKRKGFTDQFIQELMLETGESGSKPSLRLMQTIGERWIQEGIYTRFEAKRRKDSSMTNGFPKGPKSAVAKRDSDLQSRDIEIARNKWINSGGNPDEFEYGHASNS
jgi:hypothetical protein